MTGRGLFGPLRLLSGQIPEQIPEQLRDVFHCGGEAAAMALMGQEDVPYPNPMQIPIGDA